MAGKSKSKKSFTPSSSSSSSSSPASPSSSSSSSSSDPLRGSSAIDVSGSDTEGNRYESIDDMWKKELSQQPLASPTAATADASLAAPSDNLSTTGQAPSDSFASPSPMQVDSAGSAHPQANHAELLPPALSRSSSSAGPTPKWYAEAQNYWDKVDATIDGMLGGYSKISPVDVEGSTAFLQPFIKGSKARTEPKRALDCGAGIGRVTKHLLVPLFESVDMVEQCGKFLAASAKYISSPKVGDRFCCGLQEFIPEKSYYSVIWVQWVSSHLTDDDFVAFFKRCQPALAPGGIICVKENICKSGFIVDKEDSSVTRSDELFKTLFAKAGLRLLKEEQQQRFPKEIFRVKMYALEPQSSESSAPHPTPSGPSNGDSSSSSSSSSSNDSSATRMQE